MQYIYTDANIVIRKMEDCIDDYGIMAKWLSNPNVLQYYEGRDKVFDLDKVMKKFGPRVRGESVVNSCIVEYNKKKIGYIQYYKIDSNEYDVSDKIHMEKYSAPYGIDLFIGNTDYWNKGIGTQLVKAIIKYLFQNEKADVIFIDPQTWNKRAIKCYEKSGFKPITIIEKREFYEGEYKDNLIMCINIGAN